jgi:UDP-glucose 4-epimerase
VVFSSSATVYGDPASVPIREDFPVAADQSLRPQQADGGGDPARGGAADPRWRVALLRYFNPVGPTRAG